MDVFKISVKIFAAHDTFAPDAFIPIFHRWIQNRSMKNHLLIDVADYAHVVEGPGTILISSEANFHMERSENRLGLVYFRKLPIQGTFVERVQAVITEALHAAAALEKEPELQGKLKFRTDEILIRFNDRLLAPSTQETLDVARPDIEVIARKLHGHHAFKITGAAPAQKLPEFTITSQDDTMLETLLNRLNAKSPELAATPAT